MKMFMKKPSEYTDSQLRRFKRTILHGGGVAETGLLRRLRGAEMIASLWTDDNKLIGLAALKNSSPEYITRIFRSANTSLSCRDDFANGLELGWVYVRQVHRGNGFALALCEHIMRYETERYVFCTVCDENNAMKKICEKLDFHQIGDPFPSQLSDHTISLYTW